MNTTFKAIRFLGLLGAASIVCMLILAQILNSQGGPPAGTSVNLNYVLTVTIPDGLFALFLVLPYSRMDRGLWTASFAFLCFTGAYVLVYLLIHLPWEDWLLISAFVLLLLSQMVVIGVSRRKLRTKNGGANGRQPFRSE